MTTAAHIYKPITDQFGNVVPGCSVRVYDAGTTTLSSATFYSNAALSAPLTNPFTSADGIIDIYFDGHHRVALGVTQPVSGATEAVFDYIDTADPSYYQTVVGPDGTPATQQAKMQFTGSGLAVITVTNDSLDGQTVINVDVPSESPDYYQTVVDGSGVAETQRHKIKFTGTGAATVSVSDDSVGDQTVVNIDSPTIPTDTDYYQRVVAPDGTVESQRSRIKFTASDQVTITVTDDSGNDQTVVNVDVNLPGFTSGNPAGSFYLSSASHIWQVTVDDTGHLTTTLV